MTVMNNGCPYIHNGKCNRGCRGFQCAHRDETRTGTPVSSAPLSANAHPPQRQPLTDEFERLTALNSRLTDKANAYIIENARLAEDAARWKLLYRRAINEANGLTNYVDDRPELRRAEQKIAAIENEARAAMKEAP